MNSIVLFYCESTADFVKQQAEVLQLQFPTISITTADETDSRLAQYCRPPFRFPTIIVFKNGAKQSLIQAKLSDSDLIAWLSSRVT